MEHFVKLTALNTGLFVEGLAAIIIAVASARALLNYFKNFIANNFQKNISEELRVNLGSSVAVALELLLGADVLMTAVSPSWNDIGMLAAIATLRTGLNYFLEKEFKTSLKS